MTKPIEPVLFPLPEPERSSGELFPPPEPRELEHATGILPSQLLRDAIDRTREIQSLEPIDNDQIQPASIDLRLGKVAHRVRASFLPGPDHTVAQKLSALSLHTLDLRSGAVLEKDCVYIVQLLEHLDLRYRTSGSANPKSSTGRLNVFARVITDYGTEFDHIKSNYSGPLYAELSPRSFSILVRTGSRLVQLRVRRGRPTSSNAALRRLHEEVGFNIVPPGAPLGRELIEGGLAVTVDVSGTLQRGFVGYKARKHAPVIDVDVTNHYDLRDFWDPVFKSNNEGIILDPEDFYILASREAVAIPTDQAAEMLAYDTLVGEFRVHYAGFFDPGFGMAETGGKGSRAVLEVRAHEVPFLLEHGQIIGRLVYERLITGPDKLYGSAIGSSYQRQGLTLSRHFKPFPAGMRLTERAAAG
ncbi:MAG: 2'-deoxycytidine 5'-triphosphate deaminase [Alphaproteobacteria bacterium]|nr:2'-deoxycytidine 5'-triphosphate deaminase [Alphaproteobacteria bacterium]